jgi:hypothetical protein
MTDQNLGEKTMLLFRWFSSHSPRVAMFGYRDDDCKKTKSKSCQCEKCKILGNRMMYLDDHHLQDLVFGK